LKEHRHGGPPIRLPTGRLPAPTFCRFQHAGTCREKAEVAAPRTASKCHKMPFTSTKPWC